MFDVTPFWISFKLAFLTTVILVLIGIPMAYWLSFTRSGWKIFIEPLVSLPLILPPTVLGFYLLLLFNPSAPLGRLIEKVFDTRVVFSFSGLLIGSVIFNLPFMVNPIKSALESFPQKLLEASWTLGKSQMVTFFKVILPNIRPAVLTGIIMSFAHTIGEFGVVLMIGGNIPKQTRVVSIAIYSEVEALNYSHAHLYSLVLIILCFFILLLLGLIHKKGLRLIG